MCKIFCENSLIWLLFSEIIFNSIGIVYKYLFVELFGASHKLATSLN